MWTLHLANGESRGPLRPQDVEADWTIWVNVWVVDSRREGKLMQQQIQACSFWSCHYLNLYLGWFEGIVCGKVDGEEENSSLIRAVSRAHDRCLQVTMKIQYIIFRYWILYLDTLPANGKGRHQQGRRCTELEGRGPGHSTPCWFSSAPLWEDQLGLPTVLKYQPLDKIFTPASYTATFTWSSFKNLLQHCLQEVESAVRIKGYGGESHKILVAHLHKS